MNLLLRKNRGEADNFSKRSMKDFYDHDRNEVFDNSIMKKIVEENNEENYNFRNR